jgi:hypothetical protein
MGFDSGSISFMKYAVVGQAPKMPDEDLLKKLSEHALRASEMGLPDEIEYGWVGPRHVFDLSFDFEHCVFNDCVCFALRIDTNKVPSEVKHAWSTIEEEAVAKGNPSGFISKQQKKLVKDSIGRKIDEELRSGKYRRSKLVPVMWDVQHSVLYGPASLSVREKLMELFNRTFDLDLHPLTSGTVALRELERRGKRREYEDFVPTRFAKSPEDPDAPAEYPWTAKGDGAKDFLGNEFLLWMWHEAAARSGSIKTSIGEVTVMFDRTLQLDCVFSHTGKESITAAGPTRLPEAIDGLRTGKVPRKAGLILDWSPGQFNLTLSGESLAVGSLKLPDVEDADTPRTLFEERITLLRDFGKMLDSLYDTFLTARATGWTSHVSAMQKWISSHVKPVARAVAE